MKILLLFIILAALPLWGQTQPPMLSNQGALIAVQDSAVLSVQGKVQNDNTGTFENHSEIYVTGDWENNANNEAFVNRGAGIVHLRGNTPSIQGQSITRFYDLRLEQDSIAYARVGVYVDGFLRLNSREFSLDTHTVEVFSPALEAVEHSQGAYWGYVSALGNGGLARAMDTVAYYFYPLGSSVQGQNFFRPLNVRPSTAAATTFSARLAHEDPSNAGLDRQRKNFNICTINDLFYHRIEQTIGSNTADLQFYYDNNTTPWNALGQWVSAFQWDNAQEGITGTSTRYNLATLTSSQAINGFNPPFFALVDRSPSTQATLAPNPICANETAVVTASASRGNFTNYDFYVDTFLVQSGPNDQYIIQASRSGDVPIWVVGSLANCGDQSDTLMLTVFDSVVAQAFSDTIIIAGTAANLRATGGDFYNWLPDSALTCAICATTEARPTVTRTYQVEVENMEGCKDTASVLVEVRESVDQVLFIPNVLTPNGDGYNDTWFIKNVELFPRNSVQIVNRWGDVVYQNKNYRNNWAGEYGGQPLPAGTYYYILDLGDDWGLFKGDVTILRE